jgi:hypothetical protein
MPVPVPEGGAEVKKPRIVAFMGIAGSGKTTAATWFSKRYWLYKRFSFAAEVKDIALIMGWDGKKDEKGRQLLQDIGMAGRRYHKDIWVSKLAKRLEDAKYLVIDDVRFQNEVDAIRANGGIVLRIVRSSLPIMDHPSETELLHIVADQSIVNDGDLTNLYKQIDECFQIAAEAMGVQDGEVERDCSAGLQDGSIY